MTFLLVRHTKWVVYETQVVFFSASRGFLENGSWVWMVHSSGVTGKAFGREKEKKILSSLSLETEFCMDYYSATFLTSREKRGLIK